MSHRLVQLRSAIAALRPEDVAGQAFAVDAHEHISFPGHISFDQRQVMLSVQLRAVEIQIEIAVFSRHLHHLHSLDQFFPGATVFDQRLNGADLQAVLVREIDQFGQPRHRAVIAHDLADHADGPAAAQFHQVHRRFRVAGALQHAAGLGAQGKDMPRLHQVFRHRGRVRHDLNGARPIRGADAGGNPARRVHAHLEIGFERLAVLRHHPLDAQLLQPVGRGGHADQATAVLGHEIDCLGCGVFSGHDQIAFILAVGVIDDDDQLAFTQVLDHRLDRINRCFHCVV